MNKSLDRGRVALALVVVASMVLSMALVMVNPQPVAAHSPPNPGSAGPNTPEYWESYFPHAIKCYKYRGSGSNIHGSVTDNGYTVTLNPYQNGWPGDHWEGLVIKAGAKGGDDGNGNAIYEHPSAGVAYSAPDGKEVSHWIVCKGKTPKSTTTTTEPSTTTTTTEPSTTTTTTEPSTTTTTTEPPPTTQPPVTTQPPPEVLGTEVLPFTGMDADTLALVALALAAAGVLVLAAVRKVED